VRVVYVTAGTVGVGDLMHGVALRRAAQRSGLPVSVSLVSPPLPFPAVRRLADHTAVEMDPAALVDPARAASTPLARALSSLKPDVVVVGHFWANVQRIIAQLGFEAWLLLRKAPPVWIKGPPQAPFAPSVFARRLEIEPVGFAGDFEQLAPLVVVNRDELVPAAAARAALLNGVDDDGRPLRLVFQAGNPGEAQALASSSSPSSSSYSHTRVIDLRDNDAPWPVADLLLGADEIVSGAGYNAYWESRWLGTAAKTTLVPFARRIDDQAWRLSLASLPMRENGADQLIRMLYGRR